MKYILLTLLFLQSFCYQACKAEIPLPLPIAEVWQKGNNPTIQQTIAQKESKSNQFANYREIKGTITRIWDGDTLTLEKDNGLLADPTSLRIRIVGIDAPEIDQPFGKRASMALRHLVLNKPVIAHIYGKDKYNRYLARIYLEETASVSPPSPTASSPGIDVGLEMLKKGMAWHYFFFDHGDQFYRQYQQAELLAREQYLGIWQADNPQEPWTYRYEKKAI